MIKSRFWLSQKRSQSELAGSATNFQLQSRVSIPKIPKISKKRNWSYQNTTHNFKIAAITMDGTSCELSIHVPTNQPLSFISDSNRTANLRIWELIFGIFGIFESKHIVLVTIGGGWRKNPSSSVTRNHSIRSESLVWGFE